MNFFALETGWICLGLTASFLALIHSIQNHRWIWVGTVIFSSFLGAGSWIGLIYLGLFWFPAGSSFRLKEEDHPAALSVDRWRRIRFLENKVKTDPWVNDLEELSDLLEMENRLSRAEFYANKALELDPMNSDLSMRLGRILYKRQRYTEANTAIQSALDTIGANREAMRLYAQTLEKLGQLEEALRIWSKLSVSTENPYELFQTARIYCRLEDEDSALLILNQLAKLNPLDASFGNLAQEDLHWIEKGKSILKDINYSNK